MGSQTRYFLIVDGHPVVLSRHLKHKDVLKTQAKLGSEIVIDHRHCGSDYQLNGVTLLRPLEGIVVALKTPLYRPRREAY